MSPLNEDARVAELSRMLSGLPESDAAATHAEELLAEGTPEAVRSDPEVIRAYLGREADEVLEGPGSGVSPEVTS